MENPLAELGTIWGFFGAVILAGIAGWFSVLQLILSKEKSISVFRQKWIDSLRNDLCSFLSQVMLVGSRVEIEKPFDNSSYDTMLCIKTPMLVFLY
jgi:hypothetical protein